jgi:hypothetical protein
LGVLAVTDWLADCGTYFVLGTSLPAFVFVRVILSDLEIISASIASDTAASWAGGDPIPRIPHTLIDRHVFENLKFLAVA